MSGPRSLDSEQFIAGRGEETHGLSQRPFPICRNLTGDGVRETFLALHEYIPLDIYEVPSGTKAFAWGVPPEPNISDAYSRDGDGSRKVDSKSCNLQVVGCPVSFRGSLTLDDLNKHLQFRSQQMDSTLDNLTFIWEDEKVLILQRWPKE